MNLISLITKEYQIPLTNGELRKGALLRVHDQKNYGWGEVAPLPGWSHETLEDSLGELNQKLSSIMKINWTASNYLEELSKLKLLPSLSFGLESALFKMLTPPCAFSVPVAALLMGTLQEILAKAEKLETKFVKLKVSQLSFEEAHSAIRALLKLGLRPRIDVNRAWEKEDSLKFFSEYPKDTFDYIEEPVKNPHDLIDFTHPFAVDESFPHDLTLSDLESFPSLKALVYKPTMQGGMSEFMPLYEWAQKLGIKLVLSSSFESDIGLMDIASMAHRLALTAPIGIGTWHYLTETINGDPLKFDGCIAHIPGKIKPKVKFL